MSIEIRMQFALSAIMAEGVLVRGKSPSCRRVLSSLGRIFKEVMLSFKVKYSPNATQVFWVAHHGRVAAFCAVLLFVLAPIVSAQQTNVTVRMLPNAPDRVVVEGDSSPRRSWSFRNSYAGVSELGARVEAFQLFDERGAEVSVRKLAPGQFEAAVSAARFRYEINLTPPLRPSDSALVSSLSDERGVFMLADLLPVSEVSARKVAGEGDRERARILFQLPVGWQTYSNEDEPSPGVFQVRDVDRAVFVAGKQLRTSRVNISGMQFSLVADGEWAFSDREAMDMATDVLKAHREVFAAMPARQGTLILIPFPQTVTPSKWSAETRGATVTLLMGKAPSKTGALTQLSVPLTHELFHLWVPNGLALDGSYDWFYEGFTIYHAARTAVRLGLLTFPEFLSAVGRSYDAYVGGVDHDRWSLVEASERRWTGGETAVYQKSMLVALLYDLRLRSQTNGKRSLNDVYREIFRQNHRDAGSREADSTKLIRSGNEVVLKALGSTTRMETFVESYINRAVTINLQSELVAFGIRVERAGSRTQVSVADQLSRQQRDLLHDLGYNDVVRSRPRK